MEKLALKPSLPRIASARLVCPVLVSVLIFLCSQTGHSQTPIPYQVPSATQPPSYPYPATNAPRAIGTGTNSMYGNQIPTGFQSTGGFPLQSPDVEQPILMEPQPGVLTAPMTLPQTPGFQPGQPVFNQPIQEPLVLDIDVTVPQQLTQRLSIGATYGSDNSLVGQLVFDEKDFDILAWPRTVRDGLNRRAWAGGGQHFRVEAVPGNELQRYLLSWSNPYFQNTDYSLSLSAYLFDRQYFDYDEQRFGGRVGVGRQLTDYLSISYGLRMESVTIDNPRVGTSSELNADLGTNNLFLGSVGLVYDTRLYPYLTGVGSYLGLKFTQAFGDYSYSRGEIDFRNYRTIYERPDGSGRHTLEFRTELGFSGSETPVFENFIAGGMTSLRGFEYRGVSPIDGGVRVGGEFEWLSSLEYNFPLTQNDMVHGVMFVDFGTVEEDIKLNSENFRVAPGLGLRVHLPYSGLAAPLAFDFAYPVSTATGDEEQTFGFLIGVMR